MDLTLENAYARLEAAMPGLSTQSSAIIFYLWERDGITVARLAKDLSLGQSVVRRAMAELGEDIGVGLVTAQYGAAGSMPQSVNLIEKGRELLTTVLGDPE